MQHVTRADAFASGASSEAEVLAEAFDRVHALVQDRHDADVVVQQPPPADDKVFVTEAVALDPELGRDGSGRNLVATAGDVDLAVPARTGIGY